MTITVNFATVTASIAALSISGVYVKDIDEIPANAGTTLPVLFPRPDDFITDVSFERVSMGSGGTAKMDFSYTLHYRYLHAVVGARLGLASVYAGLITNLATILAAIFGADNISGAVDMQLESISNIGVYVDSSDGTKYHGVDIALRVLEFAQ